MDAATNSPSRDGSGGRGNLRSGNRLVAAPLRIAQIVRPAAGGIRRHVSDLLLHLDRTQCLPTLFAPADFEPQPAIPELERHTIALAAKTRPLADLSASRRLAQLLNGKFDIVHAHGLRGALIGGIAARRAHIPYLFTVHNLLPAMNPLAASLFRLLAQGASRIIAVSSAVAATLEAQSIPSAKIVILGNGVDMARFKQSEGREALRRSLGIEADGTLILGVGRLSREKGFDVLLDAFATVQRQNRQAKLIIVGEGAERENLERAAQNRRADVRFLGHLAEPAPLMMAADVVVIPSRQEGQGIVALEGMAAGRPIIASRVGGLVDTIREGETGQLVAPEDSEALAGTILSLIRYPERNAAMGQAGRAFVTREYSLVGQVRKVEAVYRDVLGSSNSTT